MSGRPVDAALVERAALAIFDAENGIDGDTIGTMIHGDFRITPDDGNRGVDNAFQVCRIAARAALSAILDTGDGA